MSEFLYVAVDGKWCKLNENQAIAYHNMRDTPITKQKNMGYAPAYNEERGVGRGVAYAFIKPLVGEYFIQLGDGLFHQMLILRDDRHLSDPQQLSKDALIDELQLRHDELHLRHDELHIGGNKRRKSSRRSTIRRSTKRNSRKRK